MISNDFDDEIQDKAVVTDINGVTREISFPACYHVTMSFRMIKPLKNPYIEAFLQLGQNIPCRTEGARFGRNPYSHPLSPAESFCPNITKSNWCPQSTNPQLRSSLKEKDTCQFCQLCNNLKADTKETAEVKQYVSNLGSGRCDTTKTHQTLNFKMCTPSRLEMEEKHEDMRDKFNEYWQYLKQGVLTAVIHVMDREPVQQSQIQQCQKMCNTMEKSVSGSYRVSSVKFIEIKWERNSISEKKRFFAKSYRGG
ncbi:hypothetical protein WR25_25426 isoform C [Diploscapter pachys]|uniref:Uncharacterized protein n=1 Tax=Diploscapter pachys TaxID=2018661 RepID=A0A2A2JGL9_9BILA|nr:hypothetical protein WR25_25426 isoform C [Diploscapter pachys]